MIIPANKANQITRKVANKVTTRRTK